MPRIIRYTVIITLIALQSPHVMGVELTTDHVFTEKHVIHGSADPEVVHIKTDDAAHVTWNMTNPMVIDRPTRLFYSQNVDTIYVEKQVYTTPKFSDEIQTHYSRNFIIYGIIAALPMLIVLTR